MEYAYSCIKYIDIAICELVKLLVQELDVL